jgi:hypothetical protein
MSYWESGESLLTPGLVPAGNLPGETGQVLDRALESRTTTINPGTRVFLFRFHNKTQKYFRPAQPLL